MAERRFDYSKLKSEYEPEMREVCIAITKCDIEEVKNAMKENGGFLPEDAIGLLLRKRNQYWKVSDIKNMIDFLLDNNALISREPGKYQPLQSALKFGDIDIVRYLLEKGADPNPNSDMISCAIASRGGELRLSNASGFHHEFSFSDEELIEVILLLLKYNAVPSNMTIKEAITLRGGRYLPEIIRILLETGINPNNSNILLDIIQSKLFIYEYLDSELNRIYNLSIEKVIILLLQYGADPNLRSSEFVPSQLIKSSYISPLEMIDVAISWNKEFIGNRDLRIITIELAERIKEIFIENSSEWWRPQNVMRKLPILQMVNFKFSRRRAYGACCAVLLSGDRLHHMEEGLPPLPNEILILILEMCRSRELGARNNSSIYNPFQRLSVALKEENNSLSSPKIEEISSEDSLLLSNEENGGGGAKKSNFLKSIGFLSGGGKKKGKNDKKLLKLASKIINMDDNKLSAEEHLGIREQELESLIYMIIYMKPDGVRNETINQIRGKILSHINKSSKKSKKSKNKSIKKSRNKSIKKSRNKSIKKSSKKSSKKYNGSIN